MASCLCSSFVFDRLQWSQHIWHLYHSISEISLFFCLMETHKIGLVTVHLQVISEDTLSLTYYVYIWMILHWHLALTSMGNVFLFETWSSIVFAKFKKWARCIPSVKEHSKQWNERYTQKSESVDQSCLTLCDFMGYSPPVFSVHGILQARVLGWVAVAYQRDLPDPRIEPRFPALQEDSLQSDPPGKPQTAIQLTLIQRGN